MTCDFSWNCWHISTLEALWRHFKWGEILNSRNLNKKWMTWDFSWNCWHISTLEVLWHHFKWGEILNSRKLDKKVNDLWFQLKLLTYFNFGGSLGCHFKWGEILNSRNLIKKWMTWDFSWNCWHISTLEVLWCHFKWGEILNSKN